MVRLEYIEDVDEWHLVDQPECIYLNQICEIRESIYQTVRFDLKFCHFGENVNESLFTVACNLQ